jgi:hypothetical protein
MKELVGQGKPFYSAVDKAAGLLKRKVGTGAEFMKELMALQGIKQSEIAERGLGELMGAPKMTHEQFMQALAANPAPAIREKVLGEQVKNNKLRNQAWDRAYEDALDSLLDNGLSPDQARQEALELADERINRYLPKGTEEHRTYHGQWTLPGGENYREMLIKAPAPVDNQEKIMELEAKARRIPMINSTPEQQAELTNLFGQIKQLKQQEQEQKAKQFGGVSNHFGGEKDILASLRLKDRMTPEGKKLLHLEELQSDWHQQGRERGYKTSDLKDQINDLTKKIEETQQKYRESDDPDLYLNQLHSLRAKRAQLQMDDASGIPDAPFKKNWEEMALKRLIHHAAENGYHGIVVTPGAEQADRYSLAKHINYVIYDEIGNLRAIDKNGRTVISEEVKPEKLPEHLGKEMADKILANREKRLQAKDVYRKALKSDAPNEVVDPLYKEYLSHPIEYSGLDLEVGGEGMKGFYDKKVPNILNSIGKKHGVKTQLHAHPIEKEPANVLQVGTMKYEDPAKYAQLHHFPITEQMRKDVLTNGLPLYQKGGIIHKAQGGAVKTFDYENPQHTMSVAEHLSRHPEFKKASSPAVDIKNILHEMLSKGDYRFLEDPRTQEALHKAGHDSYFVQEKTGKVSYPIKHVVKKAFGGSINEMKAEMMGRKPTSFADITQIGANEAPDMNVKAYVPPTNEEKLPVGGVSTHEGALPIGGVDMNTQQQGQQLMPQSLAPQQPPQGQQGGLPPQGQQGASAGASSPSQQSNILQMTPQGQALSALKPVQQQQQPMPQMADGGLAHLKDGDQPPKKKLTVAEQKQAIFTKAQEGLMKPSEALGKHEGKYMHITEADRAKVEKRKHGMRGGVGFSQIGFEDPEYEGMSWGVGKPGTGIKLLNRQKRGLKPDDQSIYTTFIGTPEMHTSNQLVFNRMYNKFIEARKAGLLSPEQEAQMLDIMRSAMTKGTKKNPSKSIFDKDVSFDNSHHLFDTFERRRILSNLMAGKGVGGKKGQIFDASKMIEDTTDPRLLHAPTLSVGPHTFSLNGKMSNRPDLNKAFPIMLHGESHPEAFQQLPFKEAAPEFTEQIRKAKGRDPGYMDIVRGIPRQFISEEYLTGLQKKGKKKGGKVSMDVMTLELTRKSKKAK